MRGIRRAFHGVHALRGVDFEVRRGEVHGLVGENGAGKSTLMRILGGVLAPAPGGEIWVDGVPVEHHRPAQANRLGIRLVHQELNLVPQLSIAENVFLDRLPKRGGLVDRRRLADRTARLLADVGCEAEPWRPVRELSVAERQMVEIAKALDQDVRLLVMDEPSTALTRRELDRLFDLVRPPRGRGVAVVYISHNLREVLSLCDRVTVLRDGASVGTRPAAGVVIPELIRMMVGREVGREFPPFRSYARGEPVLTVSGLGNGRNLAGVSLELRAGEILGIAGLVGSGRTELLRALYGADRRQGGEVRVHGRPLPAGGPHLARRRGIGLVPEDRKQQGLVLRAPVLDNMLLAAVDRVRTRLGLLRRRRGQALGRRLVGALDIRLASLRQPVRDLSGGNQQKVVLARWLAAEARILLLDEPTRGIDVGAKYELYLRI